MAGNFDGAENHFLFAIQGRAVSLKKKNHPRRE